MSGDYVVLYRLDQPTKTFFKVWGRQSMPQSDYGLEARESRYEPMFGETTNRMGSVLVVRKPKG